MKRFIVVLLGCLLLAGCTIAPGTGASPGPAPSAGAQPAPETINPACQTDFDKLRLQTAYVVNASGYARFGYYQLGRSSNEYFAAGAKHNLEDRFQGAALAYVTQQTAGWPMDAQVDIPGITITSFTEAADCSEVTLQTIETWHVTATADHSQVLLNEVSQPHTIKMVKAPGVIVEKWMVTQIS